MAFHTIFAADLCCRDFVDTAGTHVVMQSFVYFVIVVIHEVDRIVAVAPEAPTHRQILFLVQQMHLFDPSVAILAFCLPGIDMLGMAEV